MQVLLTKKKKFNIHTENDLKKMINESWRYAKEHWEVTVPILNQEEESYFRLAWSWDDWLWEPAMYSYIDIDQWVFPMLKRSKDDILFILKEILYYDN